jgi:methionyl aminopeptidase
MSLAEENVEKYYKSGKILAETLNKARNLVKPGKKVIDICEFAEKEILKNGADLAFPLNVGINEIAAHYTSPINDKTVIPKHGLVKLDLGASVDGFLSDSAITINIDNDERLEKYIIAAESALLEAIKNVKSGIRVEQLGELIEKVINKFDLKPISNLSGHQMKRYNLHAGVSVPNVKEHGYIDSYKFKEGDVFAIEPFTTGGSGAVHSSNDTYIYALIKRAKKLPKHLSQIINKIWDDRRKLPFSLRWYDEYPPRYVKQILRRNLFYEYPVLIENNNGLVGQAEHTILVHQDSCTILTEK